MATLVALGYLRDEDRTRLREARDRFLDARVALHRVSGGRSDLLTLQDQDAVAAPRGADDADALVRELGESARASSGSPSDLWSRLLALGTVPAAARVACAALGDGIVVRDDRVALELGVDGRRVRVLTLAARGRRSWVCRSIASLARVGDLERRGVDARARDAFIALLAAGRGAIPVFEALDHVGVLVRLLPEWEHVRARPQRNAYHRFTVDRHSLEAVASAALLDAVTLATASTATSRAAAGPTSCCSARCCTTSAREIPRDHSEVGAETAVSVARRIGLDERRHATFWSGWCATTSCSPTPRRGATSPTRPRSTRFARAVGDAERLDLLYVLTIGDSRATGPAAWSTSKAALVRELFVKTDTLFEEGVVVSETAAERRAELGALSGPWPTSTSTPCPPRTPPRFPPTSSPATVS